MSMIIKGVDLPKEHTLTFRITPNGKVYEITGNGYYIKGTETEAIQIPKGHGRIGDLDELQTNVIKAMTYGDALHEIKNASIILESEEE